MLIGIIIGFVLRGVVSYLKGFITLKKDVEYCKKDGKDVVVDYINLSFRVVNDKRTKSDNTVGFVYPTNKES